MEDTLTALSQIETALDMINHDGRELLGDDERLAAISLAQQLTDRLGALTAVLVAEAHEHSSALTARGTPTSSWLTLTGRTTPHSASTTIYTGTDLLSCPAVQAAALDGRIDARQGRSIVKVLKELPDAANDAEREKATELMLRWAEHHPAVKLARMGRDLIAAVVPHLTSPEDELEKLAKRTKRARQRRHLAWHSDGDGSVYFHGMLPDQEAAIITDAIERQMESDRRRGIDEPDQRSRAQRRVDALVALLGSTLRPRGNRGSGLVATISIDRLLELAEQAGLLVDGTEIGPGELRRMLCDHDIIPMVLGGDSEILDVGTQHRLVTPAMRTALTVRDGGCIFPGCDKAPSECEAHHVVPWWAGGRTALDNLALLCAHHHALVEPPRFWPVQTPDRWEVQMDSADQPTVIPPIGVDPERTPFRRGRPITAQAA